MFISFGDLLSSLFSNYTLESLCPQYWGQLIDWNLFVSDKFDYSIFSPVPWSALCHGFGFGSGFFRVQYLKSEKSSIPWCGFYLLGNQYKVETFGVSFPFANDLNLFSHFTSFEFNHSLLQRQTAHLCNVYYLPNIAHYFHSQINPLRQI